MTLPLSFKAKDLKAFLAEGGTLSRGQRNVACKQVGTLKLLVQEGPLDAADLYAVAGLGGPACLKHLFKVGGIDFESGNPTRKGLNPLLVASKQKKTANVSLLLEHGVNPNAVDDDGMSALDHAVKVRSEKVARALVEGGATAGSDHTKRQLLKWGLEVAVAADASVEDQSHRDAAVGEWTMVEAIYPDNRYKRKGHLKLAADGTGEYWAEHLKARPCSWTIDGLNLTVTILGEGRDAQLSADGGTLHLHDYDEEHGYAFQERFTRSS